MDIRKTVRGAWMGLVLGVLTGTGGAAEATRTAPTATAAQAPVVRETAPKESAMEVAAERAVKVMRGDSIAPLVAKVETEESKARRLQHAREVMAVRAATHKMDQDYVKAVREREKARREAEKARKTSQYAPPEER